MGTAATDSRRQVAALERDLRQVLGFGAGSKYLDFYISALTEHNPFHSTAEIAEWLGSRNREQYFRVTRLPLAELRQWSFDRWTGDLRHDSGGFFSIRGLRVKTNLGPVAEWSQPIIHQPEIGVLGIITKKIDGILYFLMQAKAEPGNLNTFQLSPTVQATRSNYLRLHGGKPTLYLDYFFDDTKAEVLVDQLQSEQGARFYHKRNRNIIVRVADDHEIEVSPNHRWLTLGQLLSLVQRDNTVNMDTRSVISAVSFAPEYLVSQRPVDRGALGDCLERSPLLAPPLSELGSKLMISSHPGTPPLHTMDQLQMRLTREKFKCELDAQLMPLNEVRGWQRTADEIRHEEGKFFSVIGVRIEAASREVPAWDQPIVRQQDPGLVAFVAKEIGGVLHFLAQLKMESGNMDLLEIAPTVQCITGSYRSAHMPPYVAGILAAEPSKVAVDTHQSEEGGRFFEESNRNMLVVEGESFPTEAPARYLWMSLRQLKQLIKYNNHLNVEARSLLSCLEMR